MDRKAKLREYKSTPLPAGVFAVRNLPEDRLLIGVSPNLPGMLNRQRFQLELGSHPDKALQSDWDRLGPGSFAFEVLDTLEPTDEPEYDARDDLTTLLDMWLVKFAETSQAVYPSSKPRK